MTYVKKTRRLLNNPYVVDLRGYPKLSEKSVSDTLTEKDLISWMKEKGIPVTYVEKNIRKDRIPKKVRDFVFSRDSYKCKYCNTELDLTVDHIKPEALGGTLELENLQTLCRACNSKKGIKYEI